MIPTIFSSLSSNKSKSWLTYTRLSGFPTLKLCSNAMWLNNSEWGTACNNQCQINYNTLYTKRNKCILAKYWLFFLISTLCVFLTWKFVRQNKQHLLKSVKSFLSDSCTSKTCWSFFIWSSVRSSLNTIENMYLFHLISIMIYKNLFHNKS